MKQLHLVSFFQNMIVKLVLLVFREPPQIRIVRFYLTAESKVSNGNIANAFIKCIHHQSTNHFPITYSSFYSFYLCV